MFLDVSYDFKTFFVVVKIEICRHFYSRLLKVSTYIMFHPACHAQPFYALRAGHLWNSITVVSGVAHLQGGWPAAVFYPLKHPIPYAFAIHSLSGRLATVHATIAPDLAKKYDVEGYPTPKQAWF
jgi:hypothetical protein